MFSFLGFPLNISLISERYNINLYVFVLLYILSFIPVYLGAFMVILFGMRTIKLKDVLRLRFNGLQWNEGVFGGISLIIFGLALPYVYILLWGYHLPFFTYFFTVFIVTSSILWLILKLRKSSSKQQVIGDGVTVMKKDVIDDISMQKQLWSIYDNSFIELNKHTPCRQSFDEDHFIKALSHSTVIKYIISSKDNKVLGIGMITNDFSNTPWISGEYFKYAFTRQYESNLIYYFMGVAILQGYRHRGLATLLIKTISENLPRGAMLGFDHSARVNFFIPYFASIIGRNRRIRKKYLDSQRYYIIS